MRIAANMALQRVAVLDKKALRMFDVAAGEARAQGSVEVALGDCLGACAQWVGVVAGKVAPAGASIRNAKLQRFSWELAPLASPTLGEVARHDLSVSADGARVVTTNWQSGYVTVMAADTGEKLFAAGESIPSGAAFSPDGSRVIAGAADQGDGAVLLFDVAAATKKTFPMEVLPPPAKKHPGLDDAPYYSAFSSDGARAALSNETWGGRGVAVYDVANKKPTWSAVLPASAEECEDWFAFAVAFAACDRVLLVACPGALRAYGADDGRALGEVPIAAMGHGGFVVDEARWSVWVAGEAPTRHALPAPWRDATALEKPSAKKPSAKKPSAKKPSAKKPSAKKPSAKKP